MPAHEPRKRRTRKRPAARQPSAKRRRPCPRPGPPRRPALPRVRGWDRPDTFLAAIGVGATTSWTRLCWRRQGYIAECVASDEDFETFKEGRDLLESGAVRPPAAVPCFGPGCDRLSCGASRKHWRRGRTTDARAGARGGRFVRALSPHARYGTGFVGLARLGSLSLGAPSLGVGRVDELGSRGECVLGEPVWSGFRPGPGPALVLRLSREGGRRALRRRAPAALWRRRTPGDGLARGAERRRVAGAPAAPASVMPICTTRRPMWTRRLPPRRGRSG